MERSYGVVILDYKFYVKTLFEKESFPTDPTVYTLEHRPK